MVTENGLCLKDRLEDGKVGWVPASAIEAI
jgi:hypothetical protein